MAASQCLLVVQRGSPHSMSCASSDLGSHWAESNVEQVGIHLGGRPEAPKQ